MAPLFSRMIVVCSFLFLFACAAIAQDAEPAENAEAEEVFAHRVLPIFQSKCFTCHGDKVDDVAGEFNMLSRNGLLAGGESGDPALIPGNSADSTVYQAILWDDLEMPPKENDRLTPEQIVYVKQWIDGGAPWPSESRIKKLIRTTGEKWNVVNGVMIQTSGGLADEWTNRKYKSDDLWAYQPLQKTALPSPDDENRNPIDVLVEKRLNQTELEPLPQADKFTLIRRLTFDLTGLPPTSDEIKSFLQDDSPDAFEKTVERLLSSPRYGEQWGKHWLDVVRYADSSGFSNDFARPNAWRYRDYVIRSFNADKPYDQFLSEQIAGDELNPKDPESLIATGFLRMGPWEQTSMSVAAVTRQLFLDDVTNQVGVTFLAHELRCASCHDHKFDPIPTQDYYRMQAIFAPTQFADRQVGFLAHENTDGMKAGTTRIESLQKLPGVKSLTTIPENEWPVKTWDEDSEVKGHAKVSKKRTQILARELKRFKPMAFSVYSGPDRDFVSTKLYAPLPKPDQRKGDVAQTRILTGGSIESPGETVSAGVLSVVESQRVKIEQQNFEIPSDIVGRRAALAKWMTKRDHPLTARVIANRVWQYHFGKGIAGNPNNFGGTGKKPTHPELLDFLADYLIQHDWSIKELHRLILNSKTWKRASGPISELAKEQDPDNELYSWFSPRRLSAEEIRDSMLLVSGELNFQAGGIPARPDINLEVAMQPRHIMGSVAPAYQPSPMPEQRNRRTIYAERIRTLRDPLLEVFNQPNLDVSCEARDSSTITPQAFTLLNSQNSFDRSIAMANRIASIVDSVDEQINQMFQDTFGRPPTGQELAKCRAHYEETLKIHQSKTPDKIELPKFVIREMVEEMTGLTFFWVEDLDVYASNYQPDLKPWDASPEVRALADVCLVLFNSNEFVYVY